MSSLRAVALASVSIITIGIWTTPGWAQKQDPQTIQSIKLNIPAQPLSGALISLAKQSGESIVGDPRVISGKRSRNVAGSYSVPEALDLMLGDSGLRYRVRSDRSYLVSAALAPSDSAAFETNSEVRVSAVSSDFASQRNATETQPARLALTSSENETNAPDTIVVIGTNIPGIAPDSSPTQSFDREDIAISGAATAQDFLQTLPQNFGGGSNADLPGGVPGDSASAFNGGGIGPQGSSINLRGLGSGSTLVLLNGHRIAPSSGLGDFVDISLIPATAIERIDILTDGASSIYGADAVAGVVNIVLRDDFEGVNGSFRYGTATSGNYDEYRASIAAGKNWGSGNALVVYEYINQDNLDAADRDFASDAPLPFDLLPSQRRHSVLFSGAQEITPDLEFFSDFTYSRRESGRDFVDFIGRTLRLDPTSENLNVSSGLTWQISGNWVGKLSGTYSTVDSRVDQTGDAASNREINSDLWTADVTASGSLFELPAGEVKLAVGGHFRTEKFSTTNTLIQLTDREGSRDVYAVFGEAFIPIIGPESSNPLAYRLEINASGRFSDFSDFGSTANPKVGVLWSPIEPLRLRGTYSTSFNPPPLGRVGATDSNAGLFRTSFINSVFGFVSPDPSLDDAVELFVAGTGGDLEAETSRAFTAGFDYEVESGSSTINLSGTYFDIEFENRLGTTPVPDGRDTFDAPNIAFLNPELFPEGVIVFNPSQDQINALINSVETFIDNGQDPADVTIINTVSVVRNIAKTTVAGFDFDVSYSHESELGTFSLGVNGTYIDNFSQQGSTTSPLVNQVNTLFNPVDLRIRGRLGYAHEGLTAHAILSHTNGYSVDNSPNAASIDSWTTVDLSVGYNTGKRLANSAFDNTTVRLSVLNLLDEDPPLAPSNPTFGIFGYDPTNATPLNRFIAIELSKQF